ncbi:MAG TPA: NAD-dependent epimerase/dehydratase family protein [Candidatus Acidoferrales bacterium]|nr:NAD-dependent epimerase/dehydratase family protein [Candidatus Acidoferrales bacterium]
MRVLATGGSGFIGRFAIPAVLEMGHEVAVFHRDTTRVDPEEYDYPAEDAAISAAPAARA